MKNLMWVAVALLTLSLASCGNKQQKASNDAAGDQKESVMQIDDLLSNAEALVGKTVKIEGVCTHTCKHGAKKMFLMGSDDKNVVRVEAGKLGAFDTKVVNSVVQVDGILKETRIDEAYLQNLEAQQGIEKADSHEEESCEHENQANGTTATTMEGTIAQYRAKIAERKEKTGKDYLSIYYVEAEDYEIQN